MSQELVAYDDDLPSVKSYTREEAEEATRQFVQHGIELRHRLLDLFERNAHRALGYDRFEDYARDRLGVQWTVNYVAQLRLWARIERDVTQDCEEPDSALFPVRKMELIDKQPLTRTVALLLSTLPRVMRRAAWDEAVALGSTGRELEARVKKIVRERLNEIKGIAPPTIEITSSTNERPNVEVTEELKRRERDIHPAVASFMYARYRTYSKTIYHEKSKRSSYQDWMHPDIVGVVYREDLHEHTASLGVTTGSSLMTLYSIEVKLRLDASNLRMCYFQAVSNSSWAHKGYIAAATIDRDKDLDEELARLVSTHGIGVILLSPEDPIRSQVLHEARLRPELELDTIEKLARVNTDFAAFTKSLDHIRRAHRIDPRDFDPV